MQVMVNVCFIIFQVGWYHLLYVFVHVCVVISVVSGVSLVGHFFKLTIQLSRKN